MISIHRVRAILNIDPNRTASVLTTAHAVNNGMAADPKLFLAPVPPLATLEAQITTVDDAEQLAVTRAKGAIATRNLQRRILVGMLETERSYVQTLCDTSQEKAIAIVEAAGMVVAKVPIRSDPVLKVTVGLQSGTMVLDANVTALVGKTGKKAFFNWQWTTDGGSTFHDAPSTPHGKTMIASLTPLTMVGFRVSVTTVNGPGEWSQVVTALVR